MSTPVKGITSYMKRSLHKQTQPRKEKEKKKQENKEKKQTNKQIHNFRYQKRF